MNGYNGVHFLIIVALSLVLGLFQGSVGAILASERISATLLLEDLLTDAARATGHNLIMCSEGRGVKVSISSRDQESESFARLAAITAGFLLQEPVRGTWVLVPADRPMMNIDDVTGTPTQWNHQTNNTSNSSQAGEGIRIFRLRYGRAEELCTSLKRLFKKQDFAASGDGSTLIVSGLPESLFSDVQSAVMELDRAPAMVRSLIGASLVEPEIVSRVIFRGKVGNSFTDGWHDLGGGITLSGSNLSSSKKGRELPFGADITIISKSISTSQTRVTGNILTLAGSRGDIFWGKKIISSAGPLVPPVESNIGITFGVKPLTVAGDGTTELEWFGSLGTISAWHGSYPVIQVSQGSGRVRLRPGEQKVVAALFSSSLEEMRPTIQSLAGSSPIWNSQRWSSQPYPVTVFTLSVSSFGQ
ncbi:MAG: hypothetical protein CVV64_04965 [Candidatus Wallbacteria bacterium HGW-Wallbacteria-1]|jgi:hypothetical protein|uniref:Uncharacterized protein n=1 Tax=Candidatus Wallbacteria bacterium HGW-Wallbacteria-1 TaxID=2013854 RepID=A0A2N1PS72_9BACT|nr:MAG: hypothetical protein CVV64_04965 [Candidatus Wallbacteria bacterium HGW-Wallbacteria-1]